MFLFWFRATCKPKYSRFLICHFVHTFNHNLQTKEWILMVCVPNNFSTIRDISFLLKSSMWAQLVSYISEHASQSLSGMTFFAYFKHIQVETNQTSLVVGIKDASFHVKAAKQLQSTSYNPVFTSWSCYIVYNYMYVRRHFQTIFADLNITMTLTFDPSFLMSHSWEVFRNSHPCMVMQYANYLWLIMSLPKLSLPTKFCNDF